LHFLSAGPVATEGRSIESPLCIPPVHIRPGCLGSNLGCGGRGGVARRRCRRSRGVCACMQRPLFRCTFRRFPPDSVCGSHSNVFGVLIWGLRPQIPTPDSLLAFGCGGLNYYMIHTTYAARKSQSLRIFKIVCPACAQCRPRPQPLCECPVAAAGHSPSSLQASSAASGLLSSAVSGASCCRHAQHPERWRAS